MHGMRAAAALSVASLVASAAEPLLHPSQLEEDAREALAGLPSGGVAHEIRSHSYVAGPAAEAYVVCGWVETDALLARFALFYGLTEGNATIVRQGRPIIYNGAGREPPLAALARDACEEAERQTQAESRIAHAGPD